MGTIGLVVGVDGVARCWWPYQNGARSADEAYRDYHDTEWGYPQHDDHKLYEKLSLEGFQSGLSWLTILRKRPAFRAAFAGFDPQLVAGFTAGDVDSLLQNSDLVRHRGKIEATINNAAVILRIVEQFGSFDAFVWRFAPARHPRPRSPADVPTQTPESTRFAKSLKGMGARFVGPTTAYAFLQSMGVVNDHIAGCATGDSLGPE